MSITTNTQQLVQDRIKSQPLLVWYRMLRVVKLGINHISPSFTDIALSRSQFDLLSVVATDGGRTQKVYAERMTVTKGNVTQQVQQLQKLGLVARRKEGRNVYLHLTDAGWQKLAAVIPPHDELMNEFFSTLTPEDISQLMRIIRKLERPLK
ncbi:MAG: MarR family transcriptional regulator [Chloroflexi bacterium]|nr:MarR family transcriptional regulator [Chloroflexota bacterium]